MLTFRHQASTLPMACSLRPGVLTDAQERAYLAEGPLAARRTSDDGAGVLQLVVAGAAVTVQIPAGSTWVQLAPLSDDDELAAQAEAGPPEIFGAELAHAIDAARQRWLTGSRAEIEQALDRWSADHRVRITVAPDPDDADLKPADKRRATEVRIKAARAALADLVARSVAWPGITARVRVLRQLVDEAPETPLGRAVADILASVPAFIAPADLTPPALDALRRYQAHDRRLAAAMARRGLERVFHPELDGLDVNDAWARIVSAPRSTRDPFLAELYAHINRLSYASPKAEPAQSPASG